MKPGIPWSVKGIEPEAREAAKHAARRAGMTLGEWLNTVILDQNEPGSPEPVAAPAPVPAAPPAAEMPHRPQASAPPPRPEPQRSAARADDTTLRLEDIAQQLAQLAQRERQSAAITPLEAPRAPAADEEALNRILDRIDHNERQAVDAFTAVNERLSVLGRQIAMGQKAPAPVFEKPEDVPGFSALEAAIRNVVEHIEISEKRTRDGLRSMQDRLAEMSDRASQKANPDDLLRAAPAFAGLEARIAEMASRVERSETLLEQGLPDLVRNELDHLAHRIESVRASAEQMADGARNAALGSARGELREIEQRILGVLKEAQATIGSQQTATADLQRLRGEIGGLNKRIDEIRQGTATERDVHALRVAVEQLSTRVAQGPDMRPIADMDRRLGELAQRMEHNHLAARNLPQFGELERRIAELDHRLAAAMDMQGDHQAIAALQEQIAAVNERVGHTEAQLGNLETMERAIHQLYESLEQNRQMAGQTAEDAATRAVERMLAAQKAAGPSPELRALQEGLQAVRDSASGAEQRNQETLEAVHETLEQIVNKLAELETSAAGHALAANLAEQQAGSWGGQAPVAEPDPEPEQPQGGSFFDPTGAFPQPSAPHHAPAATPAFQPAAHVPPEEPQFAPQPEMAPHAHAEAGPAAAPAEFAADAGGDDFIAAARRAAHAAASRPSVLNPQLRPDGKPEAKSGFSIPFLKRKKPETQPITFVGGKPVMPADTRQTGDSKRKKLVLAGIVLLAAVSAFAFNMLAKQPRAVKQQTTIEAPQAPATGDRMPAPSQPPKAQSLLEDGGADPLTTGSLPARKTDATLESIIAEPGTALSAAEMPPPEAGSMALREAAQRGDAKAQFIIASRYLDGQNVAQDLPKAAKWYQEAASRGLAPAQYRLATLFERGKGVPQDVATALLWYERAAEGGNVKAMHNAAVIAAGNQAGTPNYDKAFRWFTAAASHGLFDSQFNLAVLHERGLGTKVDKAEAYFWYSLAASQGDQDAGKRAEGLASSLTPDQLSAMNGRLSGWTPEPSVDDANVVAITDAAWNDSPVPVPAPTTPPPAAPASTTSAPAASPVSEAQELLGQLGYNVGTADGKMGSRTANAIRLFQLQSGMKVTGEVTPELLDEMRQRAG